MKLISGQWTQLLASLVAELLLRLHEQSWAVNRLINIINNWETRGLRPLSCTVCPTQSLDRLDCLDLGFWKFLTQYPLERKCLTNITALKIHLFFSIRTHIFHEGLLIVKRNARQVLNVTYRSLAVTHEL